MKRAHITIYGLVQGVFFRANTSRAAREIGLKGYVKNMPDGTVNIIAEGPKGKIDKLIDYCKKSPGASQVLKFDVKFEKPKNEFDGFEVRH